MTTVVLYARVSGKDQAEDDRYSLPEQMRGLRELAERLEWKVLEEVTDPGWSRSTLERPGITRVRELVARGGVDIVVAWKRDRFGAGHLPGILEEEFARQGTELRTPDDLGLSGAALTMYSGMSDTFAKLYIEDLREKTMRGKRGKVEAGRVVGSGPPPLGFCYTYNERGVRDGLQVDDSGASAPLVRHIFELVGERGMALNAVCRALEDAGHPAPGGGTEWRASTLRRIVRNDLYRPHTPDEIRALVREGRISPDALLASDRTPRGLDPEGEYGVHWFYKRRVIGPRSGPRTYRALPEEEWRGVPVDLAGLNIPLVLIERARASVEENPAPRLGGGGRVHELSGGIAVCGACGRPLTTVTSGRKGGSRKFWYYACPASRSRGAAKKCASSTHHPAGELERAVVGYVDGELLTDPSELERQMDEAIERERMAFRDPHETAEMWAEKIAKLDQRRAGYEEMRADGDMSRERFREKIASLDEEREVVRAELARVQESAGRVEGMEKAKRAALGMFGTGLMLGVEWFPPRVRRQIYGLLGLRVEVHEERTLRISGEFDADLMRLTPEVEELIGELRGIDERLRERAESDTPGSLDAEEGMERLEAELAAIRRRGSLAEGPGSVRAEDATSR